jgi:hypothetical protein
VEEVLPESSLANWFDDLKVIDADAIRALFERN